MAVRNGVVCYEFIPRHQAPGLQAESALTVKKEHTMNVKSLYKPVYCTQNE